MILEVGPLIDPQIKLGDIFTVGGMLVFITLYISNMKGVSKSLAERLNFIDKGMDEFKQELKRLNDVVTAQAIQNQRIQTLDERLMAGGKRMDELAQRFNQYVDSHS